VSGNYDIGAYESGSSGSTVPSAPTGPGTTWTTCAAEGGTCSFSGTREVRYGSGTTFVTRTFTGSASCTNAVFGDPTPYVAKTCSVSSDTVATPTVTWTTCAAEGGTCSFSGTRQVRYGSGTTFATKTFAGSASCTNAVFGDPTPNVMKSCSYSSATQ
jgi:hypothetical protein